MTKKTPSSSRTPTNSRSKKDSRSPRGSSGSSRQGTGTKSPEPKRSVASKLLAIVAAIVVLAAGAYYYLTGADPLGLFEPGLATPTPVAIVTPSSPVQNDWWRVYFTNPEIDTRTGDALDIEGSIADHLIELINNAQQSIHIASFEFNLTPVADALIAAHERGVEIRWVTDDEYGIDADGQEGHGQFAMLEKAGIEVKDDGRSALMHNKFWIFDSEIVWTGSTNITDNGTLRNNNNVIVLESSEIGDIYEREFQELWDGKFGPRSPSTVDTQKTVVYGTPVQILFAAEDEAISHVIPLIQAAEKSIRVMAFSFTHDALGEAVLDRSLDELDVKGIFETRGSLTQYSELNVLACAGVSVRQDGNPRAFHHKVIVIDDETVITGSLNFSNNADDSNDENVVIVKNRAIADRYLAEFDRRWQESRDPDQKELSCGYARQLILELGR